MKKLLHLLFLALCLLAYKANAQTSSSMGLNGVVENYEIMGRNDYRDTDVYPLECAIFNPANKRLTNFYFHCTTEGGGWIDAFTKYLPFKVKGNRPTNLSYMMENGGVCYRWTKIYFTLSYKYSGNKVVSVTHKVISKDNLNPDCSYDRKRIETHVEKNQTITYKYTEYDEHGNWIKRRASCKGRTWIETREITYSDEWLRKQRIDTYKKNNDVEGLEKYLNDNLWNESRAYGIEVWNNMVCKSENLVDSATIRKHTSYVHATDSTRVVLKNAWSNIQLHSLISANDWDGLYRFSLDSMATEAATDSARAYWNEKKWASVSDDNANYQDIAKVAVHPFAYPEQAKEGWKRVQQKYYDGVVLLHNDFRQVDEDLTAELEGKPVFVDAGYVNKVTYRRDSLRNAEITDYLQQARTAAANSQNKEAVAAAQHVLSINPDQEEAIEISAEKGKVLLDQLKTQKTLTDNDLAEYIAQNPKGKYTSQLMDTRALLLAKDAHSRKNAAKFDEIKSLPMSDEARAKVNSLSERTSNRSERGSFLHIGAEGSVGYGFGKELLEYGGGAYVRLGWTVSPINVTTGFTYNVHKHPSLSKNELEANPVFGAMNYATMEIPLQLRWNFMHTTEVALYLAAGAEFHLNKKGKYAYKAPSNDELIQTPDDKLLKKSNLVGYYSWGMECKRFIGFEVYVKHDYTARFDKEYVRQTYGADSQSGFQLFDKSEKTQLGKNWSIGVKVRFFY